MTVRLSAMFEEHMSKILYNWKTATRRENVQNGRQTTRRRRTRVQYTQNGNDNTSDSDEASSNNSGDDGEEEVINERVNGFTRNNQINQQNNNKAKYLASSSSDDGPSTSFANLNKNTRHKSDSEDSYKPNSRKRKKKVLNSSSSSDASISVDEEEDDDDDSDSDNQPLSVHMKKATLITTTRLRPKKYMCFDDSSDSDGEINKMRTRKCKRPKYIEEDSDSERCNILRKQTNGETNNDGYTVSSRGRVRRMTPRARALLKK